MLGVAGEFSRPSTAKSLRPTVKGSSLLRPKSPEPSSLLSAQFQAEELTQGLQVIYRPAFPAQMTHVTQVRSFLSRRWREILSAAPCLGLLLPLNDGKQCSYPPLQLSATSSSHTNATSLFSHYRSRYSKYISVNDKLKPYDPFADSNLTGYYR